MSALLQRPRHWSHSCSSSSSSSNWTRLLRRRPRRCAGSRWRRRRECRPHRRCSSSKGSGRGLRHGHRHCGRRAAPPAAGGCVKATGRWRCARLGGGSCGRPCSRPAARATRHHRHVSWRTGWHFSRHSCSRRAWHTRRPCVVCVRIPASTALRRVVWCCVATATTTTATALLGARLHKVADCAGAANRAGRGIVGMRSLCDHRGGEEGQFSGGGGEERDISRLACLRVCVYVCVLCVYVHSMRPCMHLHAQGQLGREESALTSSGLS